MRRGGGDESGVKVVGVEARVLVDLVGCLTGADARGEVGESSEERGGCRADELTEVRCDARLGNGMG